MTLMVLDLTRCQIILKLDGIYSPAPEDIRSLDSAPGTQLRSVDRRTDCHFGTLVVHRLCGNTLGSIDLSSCPLPLDLSQHLLPAQSRGNLETLP